MIPHVLTIYCKSPIFLPEATPKRIPYTRNFCIAHFARSDSVLCVITRVPSMSQRQAWYFQTSCKLYCFSYKAISITIIAQIIENLFLTICHSFQFVFCQVFHYAFSICAYAFLTSLFKRRMLSLVFSVSTIILTAVVACSICKIYKFDDLQQC